MLGAPEDVDIDRLDDSTLINLLDQSSLVKLVGAAKYNQRLHDLIVEHFALAKYRLNESRIDIDLTRRVPNILHGTEYIGYGMDQTLAALEFFGSTFTRLEIIIDLPGCDSEIVQKIATHVAKYCSKATQKVILTRRYKHFNAHFTFPDATSIELIHQYESKRDVDTIELNNVFPRMQNLKVYVADKLKLDQHFPNLIHFELDKPIRENRFEAFLELNPQLQSVTTTMISQLRRVNELLPNLQSIRFAYRKEEDTSANGAIHFKNAKKFSLDLMKIDEDDTTNIEKSLSLINFDHLQAFKLVAATRSMSEEFKNYLIALTAQYSLSTHLEFERFDLTSDELVRLVKPLHHLDSLKLSCTRSETAGEIQKFLLENLNVKKITIYNHINGPRQCNRFELPAQWKVVGTQCEVGGLDCYLRILEKDE